MNDSFFNLEMLLKKKEELSFALSTLVGEFKSENNVAFAGCSGCNYNCNDYCKGNCTGIFG